MHPFDIIAAIATAISLTQPKGHLRLDVILVENKRRASSRSIQKRRTLVYSSPWRRRDVLLEMESDRCLCLNYNQPINEGIP